MSRKPSVPQVVKGCAIFGGLRLCNNLLVSEKQRPLFSSWPSRGFFLLGRRGETLVNGCEGVLCIIDAFMRTLDMVSSPGEVSALRVQLNDSVRRALSFDWSLHSWSARFARLLVDGFWHFPAANAMYP